MMWPPLAEFLDALVACLLFWGIVILGTVVLVLIAFGLDAVFS